MGAICDQKINHIGCTQQTTANYSHDREWSRCLLTVEDYANKGTALESYRMHLLIPRMF